MGHEDMLSATKLKEVAQRQRVTIEDLARGIVRGGLDLQDAISAIRNWERGLMRPLPKTEDVQKLADTLSVEVTEISDWHSSYMYAPMSARKVRLVMTLIRGRRVQEAIDVLKFTRKRAAPMVSQVLKAAMADADEHQADVGVLYIKEARADEAGIRIGTKRWIAKDRGRAHPIRKKSCHIHVTVSQE